MKKLLAIETTGPTASVALIDETGRIREKRSDRTLSHLQNLIPMIGDLMEEQETTPEDLAAVAVSEGPGSFTGIRIGVATARALSQAWDLPCVPVPTLRSFAYTDRTAGKLLCPTLDARRNQVFAGAYFWDGETCCQLIEDKAWDPEKFTALAESEAVRLGLEIEVLGDGTQGAAAVSALALELWNAGKTVGFEELQPVYLRQAEAERKLRERLAREAAEAPEGGNQ